MSTVIFTVGTKGGTGKSTAVRFLVTYLREKGFDPLLLDIDEESRMLSRYFPEAKQITIGDGFSHDVLTNKAAEGGERLIFVDLKAGTGRDTLEWWKDAVFESDELKDVKFICIGSITSSPDSVQSFLNWAGELGDKVTYIVFKNQKAGNMFPDYEDSPSAIAFRSKCNPIEIDMPKLSAIFIIELERLNLTIAEVVKAKSNSTVNGKKVSGTLSNLLNWARLQQVQNGIYDQLEPILKMLDV